VPHTSIEPRGEETAVETGAHHDHEAPPVARGEIGEGEEVEEHAVVGHAHEPALHRQAAQMIVARRLHPPGAHQQPQRQHARRQEHIL
jgi:hypothetical protein